MRTSTWSCPHSTTVSRNLAGKWRQPGQRLYLESTSIARAENAGRAFGPGGSLGSGPVVPGPCGAGHFPRSDGVTSGPVVPGRRFRGVLLPRQRQGQRAAQPAGRCPPLPRGQALLLQSHDKVGDAEAKARADFDIRWKSLPPATTGGGLGGGISRLMSIPGWIPGNPVGAGMNPALPRRSAGRRLRSSPTAKPD